MSDHTAFSSFLTTGRYVKFLDTDIIDTLQIPGDRKQRSIPVMLFFFLPLSNLG